MRVDARTILTAALLIGCAPLAGCGGGDKTGNTVQMKDMEVVDGTATDAMTDLDGVQSEGTSLALPENRTAAAPAAAAKPAANAAATPASDDEEVVSDQ
ncbi:hypothetical protein PMI04_017080 [Sphingobium sp. AP49]|uniref:hypothetical protein n=1 Tax=Sphingobium sp. AP49 TaxID=1144307 RepID=UPI00026EE7E8|nr:hypothetical protein [Sphingobium sp. AP49]WHO38250.1 hypothetical protein PMI04_017080 [Sphingobium sp. AP49]